MANLASKYDFSKPSGFREIAFFYELKKNLDVKKIIRTSISQPNSGVLSGYIQALQIWSPFMTVQILLVFEIRRFL